MSDASCLHNLRDGGIVRALAPGVTARGFPGVSLGHHVEAEDLWQTPPNAPHGGRTLDKGRVVLDIFAPREEYRRAGSGLGAEAAMVPPA